MERLQEIIKAKEVEYQALEDKIEQALRPYHYGIKPYILIALQTFSGENRIQIHLLFAVDCIEECDMDYVEEIATFDYHFNYDKINEQFSDFENKIINLVNNYMEEKRGNDFVKVIENLAEETKSTIKEISAEIGEYRKRAAANKDYALLVKLWETKVAIMNEYLHQQREIYHLKKSIKDRIHTTLEPKKDCGGEWPPYKNEKKICKEAVDPGGKENEGNTIVNLTELSDEEALAKAIEIIKEEFAKW